MKAGTPAKQAIPKNAAAKTSTPKVSGKGALPKGAQTAAPKGKAMSPKLERGKGSTADD
jgi:hypothetical protein